MKWWLARRTSGGVGDYQDNGGVRKREARLFDGGCFFCDLEADPFQQCSHSYSLYAIVNTNNSAECEQCDCVTMPGCERVENRGRRERGCNWCCQLSLYVIFFQIRVLFQDKPWDPERLPLLTATLACALHENPKKKKKIHTHMPALTHCVSHCESCFWISFPSHSSFPVNLTFTELRAAHIVPRRTKAQVQLRSFDTPDLINKRNK